MKSMDRWARAGLMVFFGFLAGAAHAVGWSAQVTITNYYMQQTGNAVFTTSANTNPDGCITSHFLELDGAQPNFNLMYATIMTAVATGSPVTLYYNGCIGGNSYPLITAIAINGNW